MASSINPVLSHCGIYVRDVAKQVDFYTNVLGFVVADRGVSDRLGREFAFLTAATDPHPQVVFISGEAGIGKSRLLFEFRRALDTDARWIEGRCISYGAGMPYQ